MSRAAAHEERAGRGDRQRGTCDRERERAEATPKRDRDRHDRAATPAREEKLVETSQAESQLTETPMFSGPQVGETITPFDAKLVFGDDAGKTIRIFAEEEKAPQLLVFVHQVTRPAIGLARMLTSYADGLKEKGLRSNVVFLSDDRTDGDHAACGITGYGDASGTGVH